MTSPLIRSFSTMCRTSAAYSSGLPSREGNGTWSAEDFPGLLGKARHHGGVEEAWGDGGDPDAGAGELAGQGQRHGDDAALGRGVGGLPDLAVEGGHAGGVDYNAAPPLLVGLVPTIAAAASRITLKVPTRFTWITFVNESSGWGPSLPTAFSAMATPAQLTTP
jgi:hypothetical protein